MKVIVEQTHINKGLVAIRSKKMEKPKHFKPITTANSYICNMKKKLPIVHTTTRKLNMKTQRIVFGPIPEV